MQKNILVISSTLRKAGNSDILADEFIRGAESKGHSVEKISLQAKQIGFCKGCLSCQKTQNCIIKDDVAAILEIIKTADVIAFATPIYFYEICGQLKTLLDRTNPLFTTDYQFREIYLLATAADTDSHAVDNAVKAVNGWVECFPKTSLKGVVFGGGVTNVGEVRNTPAAEQAFKAGQNV